MDTLSKTLEYFQTTIYEVSMQGDKTISTIASSEGVEEALALGYHLTSYDPKDSIDSKYNDNPTRALTITLTIARHFIKPIHKLATGYEQIYKLVSLINEAKEKISFSPEQSMLLFETATRIFGIVSLIFCFHGGLVICGGIKIATNLYKLNDLNHQLELTSITVNKKNIHLKITNKMFDTAKVVFKVAFICIESQTLFVLSIVYEMTACSYEILREYEKGYYPECMVAFVLGILSNRPPFSYQENDSLEVIIAEKALLPGVPTPDYLLTT